MPDLKISALPAASLPLAGDELVAVVQGGITEQVPARALRGRYPSASVPAWLVAPWGSGENSDNSSLTLNTIYAAPFEVVVPISVDRLLLRSRANNLAGDQADFAIYACSADRTLPTGVPLWSSGSVSVAAQGTVFEITVTPTLVLVPGIYFFALNQNVTRALWIRRSGAHMGGIMGRLGVGENIFGPWFNTSAMVLRKDTITFGTWPTLTGVASYWNGNQAGNETMPNFVLRGV